MSYLKEFGLYFSKLREKSGYASQRQFADASGISHSTINRIEAGTHKASPSTLKVIASHLKDVTYDELMTKMGYIDPSIDSIGRTDDPSPSGKDIADNSKRGRAYLGGASSYTEEELEIARAAADAAVEAYRKGLRKKDEQK